MKSTLLKSSILISLLLATINLFANSGPVAVNDTIYVNVGCPVVYNPTLNDYDPDGDPFLISTAGFTHVNSSITISYSTIAFKLWYPKQTIDTIKYFLKDSHNATSNMGLIIVHINHNHTSDTLNINNVSVPFLPFGNAFWDFVGRSNFEVPKASGKTTIFTSVPWIGGIDQSNVLHVAAERYKTFGSDYFYGPVCDTNQLNIYSDTLWNRVWKISKAEIDYHKKNYWKSNYTIPEAIANWPAKGDTLLGQNAVMAPFIDKNGDGKYVPSDGDYPKIRGDQSVFIIFNDNKEAHMESKGLPLGVEFHETAYAYNCPSDSALNNTIFIHYDIYNRSNNNYHDVYFGLFTDFDIGYSYDDYVGSDSTRSLGYAYNGKPIDGAFPFLYSYGANPPAEGLLFLSDTMSSFMASYNTGGVGLQLDPYTDTSIYFFMQSIWGDGTHLTYGGDGYQGSSATNFIYSGDPNDSTSWSEKNPGTGAGQTPYDRRGIGSIGPFNLGVGQVKSIDLAYVYARDTSKSNLQNVDVLKNAVDKIRLYYENDSTPCGGSFSAIEKSKPKQPELRLYPVPANEMIIIDYLPTSAQAEYDIYNVAGRLIRKGLLSNRKIHQLDVSNYSSGFYFLIVRDKKTIISRKFIVE